MDPRQNGRLCSSCACGRPVPLPRPVCRGCVAAMRVDLEDLGFAQGGSLLVKRALRSLNSGETLTIAGTAPDIFVHLRAWCTAEGHAFVPSADGTALIVRGSALDQRWAGAERAGAADPFELGAVL